MMNPEIYISKNQPDMKNLVEFLSRPVHAKLLRIPGRSLKKDEADISPGFQLDVAIKADKTLSVMLEDFKKFMAVCMATPLKDDAFKFDLRLGKTEKIPKGACEAFAIKITKDACAITAHDLDGLRRALVYLEDEMTIRRFPALKIGKKSFYKTSRVRISRSPIATYRCGGGWELANNRDFYPDEYLNGLAHCGINAVWVAGLLRNLTRSKILPDATPEILAPGLDKLRELADRAAYFGIKVYLFCIEPRVLSADCKVFEKHPEIRGKSWRNDGKLYSSLCTSSNLVKKYMQESVRGLFAAVPNLAGMINIFAGERLTTCRTCDDYTDYNVPCTRCAKKPRGEVLTEVINLYSRAIKKAAPHAELIAWSYGLHREARDVKEHVMDNMDKEIVWLENFEHNGKKKYFGRFIENLEYSLCYLGPAPEFKYILDRAETKKYAKAVYAKIQLGTTYEQSAVPYIPVPESVYKKSEFINSHAVPGVFVTWLLGGYPDMMLKAFDEAARIPMLPRGTFLKRLAGIYWGETLADQVTIAWKHFFKAFQNYPIDQNVFYYGPITRSPAYQLYLEPQNNQQPEWGYNWGMTWATRNKQPFFDVFEKRTWMVQFKAEEVVELYRRTAAEWKKGMEILKAAANKTGDCEHIRQAAVAAAAHIQFESAANVCEFYHLRGAWLSKKTDKLRKKLAEIVGNDMALARKMKPLLQQDPRLGFHSELMYYTPSIQLLDEKIKQSAAVLRQLKRGL